MTKDEVLKLALEALEKLWLLGDQAGAIANPAITAIKQARALDKMADNARELGLDYEPVGLIDRLINPEQHYEFTDPKKANAVLMSLCQEAADALAAQHEPENEPYVSLASVQEPVPVFELQKSGWEIICDLDWIQTLPFGTKLYTTPPVQEPEIDGATMAGMDASIGHLSALVDELRILLGCAMDNFKMLHNAAKPDDGPDMDAIIPAIVFAKFVDQDAALRYAIKHSAHDGMITAPPAAQPAPVQEPFGYLEIEDIESHSEYPHNCRSINLWHEGGEEMVAIYTTPPAQPAVPDALTSADIQEHIEYVAGWNDCRAEMLKGMKP
jgi:hypothetical protein